MQHRAHRILFLDIGGVLLTNGWEKESREKAAQQFSLDFNDMEDRHEKIFFLYELGKIPLDEYLTATVFYKPRRFSREIFQDFMFAQSAELADTLQWIIKWKKESKIKIVSLNNEAKELNDFRIMKFKLTKCFDFFISSCEVRMRKPDPDLFRFALALVQEPPQNCIYFDDTLLHVETAKRFGIKAHHHKNFKDTKKILENLR